MGQRPTNPKYIDLFCGAIEEYCETNNLLPEYYYRRDADHQGMLRLEMDQKPSAKIGSRYQQVIRYPRLTHQRRQPHSDFDHSLWLGNPRSTPEALQLYRKSIHTLIPPMHQELSWFQAILTQGYDASSPRPLWTFDVHQLMHDYIHDVGSHFDLDPEYIVATNNQHDERIEPAHQRLLGRQIHLPFGTFQQDWVNSLLITPLILGNEQKYKMIGELLEIDPSLTSYTLKILSVTPIASGGTRLRIEDRWLPASPLPAMVPDWREPFVTPARWAHT